MITTLQYGLNNNTSSDISLIAPTYYNNSFSKSNTGEIIIFTHIIQYKNNKITFSASTRYKENDNQRADLLRRVLGFYT